MRQYAVGVARMDNEVGQALATGASFGAVGALVLGLLRMLGKGVGWLVERSDGRLREERVRLEKYDASLTRREMESRAQLKTELAVLRAESAAKNTRLQAVERDLALLHQMWRDTTGLLIEVTVELKDHAPQSEILARARAHLARKYPDFYEPPEPNLPDDIAAAAARLDAPRAAPKNSKPSKTQVIPKE